MEFPISTQCSNTPAAWALKASSQSGSIPRTGPDRKRSGSNRKTRNARPWREREEDWNSKRFGSSSRTDAKDLRWREQYCSDSAKVHFYTLGLEHSFDSRIMR
jgi:hypothetical protein